MEPTLKVALLLLALGAAIAFTAQPSQPDTSIRGINPTPSVTDTRPSALGTAGAVTTETNHP
ncbi:MAG: hypothetical protein ABI743_09650 [bacterium]